MRSKKMKFKDIVLGENGLLKGPFGSDLKKSIYIPKSKNTYKVYLQENILKRDITKGNHHISSEYFYSSMSRYEVNNDDFIVTCDGTLGEILQLKNLSEPGIISSSLLRITLDPKIINDKFFFYFFKHRIKNPLIRQHDNSVLKHLPGLKAIREFEFELIDINSQIPIGKLLSSLDSKIELNNRINAELEAMAKTLYDYWFVQFDFPDKNGKPYKTSGGKMVWNEELKREIPEGWEALKLSSKFTFEKGIEPGSAEYVEQKESIYHVNFIRVGDVDGSSAIFIDTRQKNYSMVLERDVLVTFDGSVGKVAFGLEGAYSGGLRKIYDNSGVIDNSVIYYIFKDERIIRTIHKYATGSILLHAGSSINILTIPYNEIRYLEYQNIIKSSYNKMVMNKKENRRLTELRDWLLPMLMNGQVKIN